MKAGAAKAVVWVAAGLAALGMLGAPARMNAQVVFSGVFRPTSEKRAQIIGLEWDEFRARWQEQESHGMRIFKLQAYLDGDRVRFAGLFRPGEYEPKSIVNVPWEEFHAEWQKIERQGYALIDISTWEVGGRRVWAGIFAPARYKPEAVANQPWERFHAEWVAQEKRGNRIYDFESYMQGTTRLYVGLFRPGDYVPAAAVGRPWPEFVTSWKQFERQGYRPQEVRSYVDGGQEVFSGIFAPGKEVTEVWAGREWENFSSEAARLERQGMRLDDLGVSHCLCDRECLNQVVMPPCPGNAGCTYIYMIAGNSTHCAGPPGTCKGNTAQVAYSWPVDVVGNHRYLHVSAVEGIKDQLFTLPLERRPGAKWEHNGWRYDTGVWHHAVDYFTDPKQSFRVVAAAAGTVVFMGWDPWSGNTIILSHDVGRERDAYRTIYMHLRNGAEEDCGQSWKSSVPSMKTTNTPQQVANYQQYLEATGCSQFGRRNLKKEIWGEREKLDTSLVGKTVRAGQFLGWSGQAGPGGSGGWDWNTTGKVNTHLHIFFARRDPAGGGFYLFDPYGIYAMPKCYPPGITDPLNVPCARYGVAWKGGRPQFP